MCVNSTTVALGSRWAGRVACSSDEFKETPDRRLPRAQVLERLVKREASSRAVFLALGSFLQRETSLQRRATRVVKKRGSGLDRLLRLLVRVLWRESLNDSAVVPHATYTVKRAAAWVLL